MSRHHPLGTTPGQPLQSGHGRVGGAHRARPPPPGNAAAPRAALCQAFSVSRTVVREAVKVLQEKGLVQVRQGAGTMVTPPAMWDMLDELVLAATIAEDESLAILDDLVVTRRVLECDMANVAARLAGPDTVERLRALVDRMDELVDDHVMYAESDRAFHDTIMQASGNRIARGVVRALESQVVNTARYMGRTERALCVASNRGHRRIYERIAAHDPEAPPRRCSITSPSLARPPQRTGRSRPAAALDRVRRPRPDLIACSHRRKRFDRRR